MSENRPNFGDLVKCTASIKKTGHHYVTNEDLSECVYHDGILHGLTECVDDYHNCEKYYRIEDSFCGLYVGTTKLCTILNAEYNTPAYGRDHYTFYSSEPVDFAIVYYAKNKKRLVPLENIAKITEVTK